MEVPTRVGVLCVWSVALCIILSGLPGTHHVTGGSEATGEEEMKVPRESEAGLGTRRRVFPLPPS